MNPYRELSATNSINRYSFFHTLYVKIKTYIISLCRDESYYIRKELAADMNLSIHIMNFVGRKDTTIVHEKVYDIKDEWSKEKRIK